MVEVFHQSRSDVNNTAERLLVCETGSRLCVCACVCVCLLILLARILPENDFVSSLIRSL